MESVYIETTVISYLVSRRSRDVIIAAHQQITEDWWTHRQPQFDCYVSQSVVDEISAGDRLEAEKRLSAISPLPMLEVTYEAEGLAQKILNNGVIPKKAVGDAAHIAVATVNGVDYLLTWNCAHIANAQLLRKVAEVCTDSGYLLPVICTPEELMGD